MNLYKTRVTAESLVIKVHSTSGSALCGVCMSSLYSSWHPYSAPASPHLVGYLSLMQVGGRSKGTVAEEVTGNANRTLGLLCESTQA